VDPQKLANFGGQGVGPAPAGQEAGAQPVDPQEDQLAHFTKVIFHDTEVVWDDLFSRRGKEYRKPVLVLFSDEVQSACGTAETAVGPFYCGGDQRVYIDLSFYRDMQRRLNAPGEFARAYVVAHEVGHHVQRALRLNGPAEGARRTQSKAEANKLSVRQELQADFLAGVWAYHAQKKYNFLEPGDVESAMNAAYQIGDDRLQKKSRGFIVPDAFTHGTSKQRVRWFKEGLSTGDIRKAKLLFEMDYNEL